MRQVDTTKYTDPKIITEKNIRVTIVFVASYSLALPNQLTL